MKKNINELEKAIVQLNYEYEMLLNSKEYTYGKRIVKYFDALRKLDLKNIYKLVKNKKFYDKAGRLFIDIKRKNSQIQSSAPYLQEINDCEKTITVYTCITGNYDLPKTPLVKYKNYRYVMFTDQRIDREIGWEIRELPKRDFKGAYLNRYIKFHPDVFFDSDYCFYLDGNVRMLTGFSEFLKLSTSYYGVGMYDHAERNCLYREAETCIYLGKGNKERINKQIQKYKQEGLPTNFGLKEATIIGTDMNNKRGIKLLHDWWDEFVSADSGRDQLAFPYIVWRDGRRIEDIYSFGENIRTDPHLQVSYHN